MDGIGLVLDDEGMKTSPTKERPMLTITHPFNLRDIAKCGTDFVGYGGMKMTTNRVSYGVVPTESVLDGTAKPERVVATSDGRGYIAEWATDADGESVYVEVYSDRGREFHGFIDRESRKIVQAG